MKIYKIIPLLVIAVALVAVEVWHGSIPQPQDYHDFADQRNFLGVNNFTDVVSNALFFIVGLFAFCKLIPSNQKTVLFVKPNEKVFYLIFFGAIFLVSLGSSYYHLWPSNQTLLWDRLPIAVSIMSFFSAIIAEYIDYKWGIMLLPFLILLGLFSILYWYWGVATNSDDLRIYLFVLLYPVLAIFFILLMFESRYTQSVWLWLTLILYVVARVCELYDVEIYRATEKIISGHSLKHLSAGLAGLCIWLYLYRRKIITFR